MPRDEYDDPRDRDDFDPGFEPRRRRRPPPKRGGGNTVVWVLGGFGCLGLLVCAGVGGLVWWALAPTSFPEQTQDYADARKAFRTTLTTAGPAPQFEPPLDPPADVDVVEYKSGDLTLTAWASKPPAFGGGKQPGVLYLHSGFGFGVGDWEETEPLRKAGFAVLIPILRGENGQKGNFTLFCDEVGDALAAADVLARRPGVDPDRLFVAGYSSGGTLAMLTAMADKRFKGCAAVSGSPDQGKFTQFRDEAEVPFDKDDPKEIAIRSPLAWPKSFKCPARLYVGKEELPYMWATNELAKKAKANGQDVVCEELDGDHSTVVQPALARMVAFFQSVK